MPIRHRIRPDVVRLTAELVAAGHEAYIVGGAVRDLLLGIEPKDYDIATSATPEQVRAVFGRRRSRIIGRRFRLVHVYTAHDCFEVSTFRREPTPEERSSRENDDGVTLWRDNEYGTLEQDARRRDFTVNALYYDPVGGRGIIDFAGGVHDLESGTVRSIGDPVRRLEEDPVRVLRALKLVGQYRFGLEPGLAHALARAMPSIERASPARLFEEMLKILVSPHGFRILDAFQAHGFLRYYCPRLAKEWTAPHSAFLHGLLRERGVRLARGDYSSSKALAMATVSLPVVCGAFGCPGLTTLWDYYDGIEHDCTAIIRALFAPLPVSRFLSARARDIVLLLPRLARGERRARVMRHPEYKYARELFALAVVVCGRGEDVLATWPAIDPRPVRHPRRQPGRRPAPHVPEFADDDDPDSLDIAEGSP